MVLSLKPTGSTCNMSCAYCYYAEKFSDMPRRVMSAATLELAIRQYAAAMPSDADLHFLWHGGEPLLMPLAFYRNAVELQRKYAAGRKVYNSLQSNGTLLNSDFIDFFAAEDWLLGISIDGPQFFNDCYRKFHDKSGTFRLVADNITQLNEQGVKWNAMATVNSANVTHPVEFYDFFRELGTRYLQFSPVIERRRTDRTLAAGDEDGSITPESITAGQWGDFLCAVFDRWVSLDVGRMFVQLFESTLAGYLGAAPGTCIYAPTCGGAPVIEANGDVYCCDHFVFDRFRLGNITHTDLHTLLTSESLTQFGHSKHDRLPQRCRKCQFLTLCNGECPKNRFVKDASDPSFLSNYLCEGYKRFFEHSRPFMLKAKRLITGQ